MRKVSVSVLIKVSLTGNSISSIANGSQWYVHGTRRHCIAPTEILSNVKVEPMNSRSIRVLWKSTSYEGNSKRIEGYYIGYREANSFHGLSQPSDTYTFKTVEVGSLSLESGFQVLLSDLKRNTKYGIIVQAFNRKGPGQASEEIITQTLEFGMPTLDSSATIAATFRYF